MLAPASETGPTIQSAHSSRLALIFAFATLFAGFGVAAVGYALGEVPSVNVRRPPVYPDDWMFWSVWLVLYPTMGVSSHYLWIHRQLAGTGVAWRYYLLGLAANFTWIPVVHLSHSPVAAPAIMDALSGLLFLPAIWKIARSNRPAFLWLMPLLVWGPITGTLKIWQLLLNQNEFSASTWHLISWSIYAGAISVFLQIVFTIIGLRSHGIR